MRIRTAAWPLFLLFFLLFGCSDPATSESGGTGAADLILTGGKIVTVDEGLPEARALAVLGGRVLAIGTEEEIDAFRGPDTRIIDLAGKLAIPGFIESHAHFKGIGTSLLKIDLRSATSWDEVIRRAAAAADEAGPGEWILGWGWHQEKWDQPPTPAVEGYPVHDALSAATPDNPVMLKHAAGSHAGIVNEHAMRMIGIDSETPDPPGGRILRHPDGRPTGALRETAYRLAIDTHERALQSATPEEREAWDRKELELAAEEALARGITSFQDAGTDLETIALMRRMAEAGELGVRLWVMVRDELDAIAGANGDYRVVGGADDRFTVRAIKLSIDGALGSHGAWLLSPYEDLPSSSGLNTVSLEDAARAAEIALQHDLQLCVHAIGDRGNRETLDLFERVLGGPDTAPAYRWRIEHAQHLHPDDIPRFGELGIVASMQGVHCTSDGPWVPKRLGDRRAEEGAYVWRRLLDSGAVVSNGTDAPVEDIDPISNFYSTVTRRMDDGNQFYPAQVMTRMEALQSYTIHAAYAAFEEDLKGSLAPGKLADIVVLSRDLLTVPEEEILETEVVWTIVGGEVLYEKP